MMAKVIDQYSAKKDFNNLDLEQKILDRSARFRIPEGKPREEALAALKARIPEGEKSIVREKARSFRLVYLITSGAAGLLLLFGIWQIWIKSPETKIIAGRGVHSEYQLPDGSGVRLNSESTITFTGKTFAENRHLVLNGEAFFEVTKGSPFTISTVNGDIRALGTSFNVFSRDNMFRVSCITGKVLVSAENQSVTITPGESASLSGKDLVSFREENLNFVTGWISGEFYYENSSLNQVFSEIERQFNVNFAFQNPEERFFTGSFTNKDLKVALDIVCIPLGLRYEIGSDGKIFIIEAGK